MIPKIIHYCWFGGKKLPAESKKYIEGWKRLCPDFEIREWNESNLDFSECRYARQAYAAGKWAFVSDYVRFKILDIYGGVYLDTDVELLKSPLELMKSCEKAGAQGYMGIERADRGEVAPGLGVAAEPGSRLIKALRDRYLELDFTQTKRGNEYLTVVEHTTEVLKTYGLSGKNEQQDIEGFRIYPADYLNPTDMNTYRICPTKNTISVHHYASSWVDGYSKFRGSIYRSIYRVFGKNAAGKMRKIFGRKA